MKKNNLTELESLANIVKKYKILYELVVNDRLLHDGYYKNIYDIKGINKQKPKFQFGIFFILCAIFIPGMCGAFAINAPVFFVLLVVLFIILIVLSIILYNSYVRHWIKTNNEIIKLKTDSNIELIKTEKKITQYNNMLPKHLLLQADKIYEDMKVKGIESIKDYLNYKKESNAYININVYNDYGANYYQSNTVEKYSICEYCGTTNNIKDYNCKNCGAHL